MEIGSLMNSGSGDFLFGPGEPGKGGLMAVAGALAGVIGGIAGSIGLGLVAQGFLNQ